MTRITVALLLGALALGCGDKEEGANKAAPEAAEPAEAAPEADKPAQPAEVPPEAAEAGGDGEDGAAAAVPTTEDFEDEAADGITEKNLEKELAEIEKALDEE